MDDTPRRGRFRLPVVLVVFGSVLWFVAYALPARGSVTVTIWPYVAATVEAAFAFGLLTERSSAWSAGLLVAPALLTGVWVVHGDLLVLPFLAFIGLLCVAAFVAGRRSIRLSSTPERLSRRRSIVAVLTLAVAVGAALAARAQRVAIPQEPGPVPSVETSSASPASSPLRS